MQNICPSMVASYKKKLMQTVFHEIGVCLSSFIVNDFYYRRMFPLLQISLSGLEPSSSYAIFLQFQLAHPHRWRFLNGEWQGAGSGCMGEPPEEGCVYIHHSSPLTGAQWMKEKITFSKLKLSNKESGKGKVRMHAS